MQPKKFDDIPQRRLDFGHFVDRVFWAILSLAATYSASEIRGMANSIAELNQKMAVVIQQIADTSRRADGQDKRIDRIEDLLRSGRR